MSDSWVIDPADAAAALEVLRGARTVLMPTHQNVDADGLSSPLAMRLALAEYGVDAYPVITDGDLPSNLRFLPGIESVLIYGQDELPDYDLICLIDCADRKRLGNFAKDDPSRLDGSVPIVNIDHHKTNSRFGVVNIVEPEASSSGEIVAEIFKLWGLEITPDIARNLLAGIYGDTLGLRTPSTTPHTIRTVADLVERGAELEPVVDHIFRLKPRSTICLWEHALHNIRWNGPIIWTEMTREGFQQCGAEMSEAEGIVNFLSGTQGSRVAVILYQDEDKQGWRVSLRGLEKTLDVSAIAAHFGGGGHPLAAGAHVEGGEAEKQAFIQKVAELVAETPELEAVPVG
ncbi:MAG: bifunctional oligoribonuclease/PAP phosphatase NrnA [Thermomicrobiales bacterium]|nr:bifunctional oligoribonuclease/PAP phosphatase NrnA [Thermomicrobiales bacterium]